MAVFLRWRDYAPGSKERFISDLFATLSPRWYPVNIIGSNLYDVFEMYAVEFASASVETAQTFDDLFIDTVRTTPIGLQSTSKMYDNFGALLGVNKLSTQSYDTFNTGSIVQSFRQQLRILSEAFFAGTSVEGAYRVGQAYTGVAPLVIEPVKNYPGWTLTVITGSVEAVGPNYIVSETYVPHLGFLLPAATASFVAGDEYILSYSKLGYNTIIHSGQHTYSGMDVFVYASTSVSDSFRASFERSFERAIRADIRPRYTYTNNFVYYRPQIGTGSVEIDDYLTLSERGYLYNAAATPKAGAEFTGSVVTLPSNFASYDWFYDWLVLSRNDAYYDFAIRSYPSASIPDTVDYISYNPEPIDLLVPPSVSISAHWVFNAQNTLWDITGNGSNLIRRQAVGATPIFTTARDESRVALLAESGAMVYTGSVGAALNLVDSFTCEMWLKGIDKTAPSDLSVIVKRQTSQDYTPNLTTNGYMFAVNVATGRTELSTRNTSISTVTGSISAYLLEEPERYHYFAYTFASGSAYLYVDDSVVASGSGLVTPASQTADTFVLVSASGSGVAIDEIVLTDRFMTDREILQRYRDSKPRLSRVGIPSGSVLRYHQPKITIYASGSNEVEFHQFSIRGLEDQGLHIFSPESTNLYRLPLFELESGSII